MKKAIIIICFLFPIAVNAADFGGSYGKDDEYKIHNNNNYWLTVFDLVYEGTSGEEGPSGEYPGGSGNNYLWKTWALVGVRVNTDIKVSNGKSIGFGDFRVQGNFYSTDTEWPSGFAQYGDYDTSILCDDFVAGGEARIPIYIRRQTWSFTNSSLDDCIGYKYVIQNIGNDTFDEVYVAHRPDFDIGDAQNDVVSYDLGRELAYTHDSGTDPGFFGVTCGTGNWSGVGFSAPPDSAENTINEWLFGTMQGYGWTAETTPDDYRIYYVFEFDPMDFEPGETIIVGFYHVAGMTLAELQANADAARASYVEDEPPLGIESIKSASLGEIKAIFK